MDALPSVSVVICTRNRPGMIGRAVESVLASTYAGDLSLVVVDQSDDDATERALAPFRADARLQYIPTVTRGQCAARNIGAAKTSGTLLFYTDDDCVVPPDWISRFVAEFERLPDVGIVFGRVDAWKPDDIESFTPIVRYERRRKVRSLSALGPLMGASMAFRRDVITAIGPFDEELGPGGPLWTADDMDFAARALIGGFALLELPAPVVLHYGSRPTAQIKPLLRNDLKASGAVVGKLLRARHWDAALVALSTSWRAGILPPARQLVRGQRPRGLGRNIALAQGIAIGLRRKVQRDPILFEPTPRPQPLAPREATTA